MTIHLPRTTSINSKKGVSFGSYLYTLLKFMFLSTRNPWYALCSFSACFSICTMRRREKTRPPMFTEEEECYFYGK